MSTGQLTIKGTRARYELRMPAYELQHVPEPAKALPAAIRIDGAEQTRASCSTAATQFICELDYVFRTPPGAVDLHCVLARLTVANHVHVLQARNADRIDQAVFEGPVEDATLRFRTMGPIESALRARPWLLLGLSFAALALATLGEGWIGATLALTGALAGMALFTPLTPRFLETTLALLAAYSGFERAMLPRSRYRWIAASLIGFAVGAYLQILLVNYSARAILGAPILLLGAILPSHKWLSIGLIVSGLLWFGLLMH